MLSSGGASILTQGVTGAGAGAGAAATGAAAASAGVVAGPSMLRRTFKWNVPIYKARLAMIAVDECAYDM